jgi:ferric-dicitrate binding protein FerR (iron transport regulator)
MDNSTSHNIFWGIIGKILASTANEKESKQFMGLILKDSELMEVYIKIQEYWNKASGLGPFELIDVEADWKQVYAKILEHERNNISVSGPSRKVRFFAIKYLAYAASLFAVVVFSWLYFSYNQSVKDVQKNAGLITHIEAPLGSRSQVILPDGSTIWLNAGSSIRYSGEFSRRNREVFLVGEAFFNVEKQDIPFVVNAFDISFTVLGTSFNLKAYNDEEVIEATLVSGSLLIEDADGKAKRFRDLVLKPNQKATFHRVSGDLALQSEPESAIDEQIVAQVTRPLARIEVRQKQSVVPEISWKDGVLIVEGEPLSELARKLERRFDVIFEFKDERLKNFKYSGTLKDQTLEQVLQAMKLTSPIEYQLEDKTVTIHINQLTKSKYKDYLN